MATNYTLNDVAKIITEGKDFEAITEIGKRFPILAVKVTALAAKAPVEFKDLMSYMPDHVTANKINKAIKDALGGDTSDEDVEDDTTDEDEAPAEKSEKAVKKSVAKKKAEVTEKNEDGTYDYDSMNNAQMYKLLGELGKRKDCKEKMGGMSHDQMLEYLKKYGPGAAEVEDEEADEDWGEEEADVPADPYEGKTAVELFKECKKRGIKAPAKKSDKFYADLLRKADAEAETEAEEAEDDDEDGWEEVDIEEERKAAKKAEEEEKKAEKKAPAKKAPVKAAAKKAPAKKAEPEDDDDDDWDI